MQRFVDAYTATKDRLAENDREGAVEQYRSLLAAYNDISGSDIEQMHKELAYDQLVKVHQALQEPRGGNALHATTHIIAAAMLLVLFSIIVFFRPATVGFVTAEPLTIHELDWAFTESGTRQVHLDALPRNLRITGRIDGNGYVKVYARTPNQKLLLFDNYLLEIGPDSSFAGACTDTCALGPDSTDFSLEVVVDNAALTIYSLEYLKA